MEWEFQMIIASHELIWYAFKRVIIQFRVVDFANALNASYFVQLYDKFVFRINGRQVDTIAIK